MIDDRYLNLLITFPPRPIKLEEDFARIQAVIDNLVDQENLTLDEQDYLNVLGSLVRDYEDLHQNYIKENRID